MHLRSVSLLTFCFLLSVSISAHGFSCPTKQLSRAPTSEDKPLFKELVYADRGDRCEGFLRSYTGTPTLIEWWFDMIAFGRSTVTSLEPGRKAITLKLSAKRFVTTRQVRIVAQSYSLAKNYRMDALPTGGSFVWSLNEVVRPAISKRIIVLDNIGILGHQDVATNRVFHPIDLLWRSKSGSPPHVNSKFRVVIRPRRPAWNPRFEVCQARGHCCDGVSNPKNIGHTIRRYDVFEIPIARFTPGAYCLAVQADFCPPNSRSPNCSRPNTHGNIFYLKFDISHAS